MSESNRHSATTASAGSAALRTQRKHHPLPRALDRARARLPRWPLLAVLALGLATLATASARAVEIHEGEIDGAPYTVAVPDARRQGRVFLPVHGWRPADAPHLADLDLTDPFIARLLADGWVIGRTAFRENGVDHPAHTRAVRDLRDWIAAEIGPVELLIMDGESTAGTLMARIAEQDPALADGVIAMAPFFDFEDEGNDAHVRATPRIPLMLMSNITEIEAPVAYAARAANAAVVPSLRPILRPGHVNINAEERWAALAAMQRWIEDDAHPGFADGTRTVPPRATGTTRAGGTLVNRVRSVNPFYGNATLDFHPDEWRDAGFEQGESFEIEIHGERWPVLFGTTYGDVPVGEWVAFPTADARILLVRNHRNASRSAGLSPGDTVQVRALAD